MLRALNLTTDTARLTPDLMSWTTHFGRLVLDSHRGGRLTSCFLRDLAKEFELTYSSIAISIPNPGHRFYVPTNADAALKACEAGLEQHRKGSSPTGTAFVTELSPTVAMARMNSIRDQTAYTHAIINYVRDAFPSEGFGQAQPPTMKLKRLPATDPIPLSYEPHSEILITRNEAALLAASQPRARVLAVALRVALATRYQEASTPEGHLVAERMATAMANRILAIPGLEHPLTLLSVLRAYLRDAHVHLGVYLCWDRDSPDTPIRHLLPRLPNEYMPISTAIAELLPGTDYRGRVGPHKLPQYLRTGLSWEDIVARSLGTDPYFTAEEELRVTQRPLLVGTSKRLRESGKKDEQLSQTQRRRLTENKRNEITSRALQHLLQFNTGIAFHPPKAVDAMFAERLAYFWDVQDDEIEDGHGENDLARALRRRLTAIWPDTLGLTTTPLSRPDPEFYPNPVADGYYEIAGRGGKRFHDHALVPKERDFLPDYGSLEPPLPPELYGTEAGDAILEDATRDDLVSYSQPPMPFLQQRRMLASLYSLSEEYQLRGPWLTGAISEIFTRPERPVERTNNPDPQEGDLPLDRTQGGLHAIRLMHGDADIDNFFRKFYPLRPLYGLFYAGTKNLIRACDRAIRFRSDPELNAYGAGLRTDGPRLRNRGTTWFKQFSITTSNEASPSNPYRSYLTAATNPTLQPSFVPELRLSEEAGDPTTPLFPDPVNTPTQTPPFRTFFHVPADFSGNANGPLLAALDPTPNRGVRKLTMAMYDPNHTDTWTLLTNGIIRPSREDARTIDYVRLGISASNMLLPGGIIHETHERLAGTDWQHVVIAFPLDVHLYIAGIAFFVAQWGILSSSFPTHVVDLHPALHRMLSDYVHRMRETLGFTVNETGIASLTDYWTSESSTWSPAYRIPAGSLQSALSALLLKYIIAHNARLIVPRDVHRRVNRNGPNYDTLRILPHNFKAWRATARRPVPSPHRRTFGR
eukprot:tig00000842_g4870.t1